MRSTGLGLNWDDGELTISRFTGPYVTKDHKIPQKTVQEFSATPDEWLDLMAQILVMLEGKPDAERKNFLIGPQGMDPGLVGDLIAHKFQEARAKMRKRHD